MTRALPPMVSFSELVGTALRAATHHLAEGSRRNALDALEVRYDLARQGHDVLAALPDPRHRVAPSRESRRSTA